MGKIDKNDLPPIMGAAILFITSAPVPELNIIGINPARITLTVIILGRMRPTLLLQAHRTVPLFAIPIQ